MKIFQKFISTETSGGFWLLLATILAMIWSNSPWHASYETLRQLNFSIKIDQITQIVSLPFIINQGLMTLFFFLIGLEVKRELIVGELNSFKKAVLPGIAALGGMIIPAIIYLACNWHQADGMHGWAIPTATDIAFSLAVLSLLGRQVPLGLKVFLTALAIFDDLGAILIIAIFYTQKIAWIGIALAALIEILLIVCNIFNVISPVFYCMGGVLIWWLLLTSGIHPTLAGVLVALTIPLLHKPSISPANQLEKILHPWVTFLVLPLFAFLNAGIRLDGGFLGSLINPVSLGIILGLLVGKPLGVFSFCWIAVKNNMARLPHGVHWKSLAGISLLCGIGFTMSFFIGFLSFENGLSHYQNDLRAGILLGSLLSGLFGYVWLRILFHARL
jgi:NhaA family Na+:H+ antiporter